MPSAGSSCRPNLLESDKLPEPIFTPATKAEIGDHDENVDFDRAAEIVGDRALMEELRRISIEVYKRGAEHAAERGIILADTKFEFGRHAGAEIVLGDEVLTPDSSRFWPADRYEPGKTQPSFDKQYVRDWATEQGWDKTPPAPELPPDVVEQTRGQVRRGLRADHGAVLLVPRARVLIRPRRGSSTPRARRSSGRCRRSASRGSSTSGSAAWSSWRPRTRSGWRSSARSCSPTR